VSSGARADGYDQTGQNYDALVLGDVGLSLCGVNWLEAESTDIVKSA
jgi:hypothetical protein